MTHTDTATPTNAPARALLVVDVQNDFCEGGSLAVEGGAAVAERTASYLDRARGGYAAVVATADWHVDPGDHFSDSPDFVDSWPVHCVAGSPGADFHPAFADAARTVDAVFRKGEHTAAYSGFEGHTGDEAVPLARWLADRGVTEVDVVGLATDHCVRATALDAVREGLRTRLLLDLSAGVADGSTRDALAELHDAGVEITTSTR